MNKFLKFFTGPDLYKIYEKDDVESHLYERNVAERFSGSILKWMNVFWRFKGWLSPLLFYLGHRRGVWSPEGVTQLLPFVGCVMSIFIVSHAVRALGRLMSHEYREFLQHLTAFQQHPSQSNKNKVMRYDFHFSAWPVEFQARDFSGQHKDTPTKNNYLLYLISGACVNTFGVGLLYPGSWSFMQGLLAPALIEGREKLVAQHKGMRIKLRSCDHNDIDCLFIDRRSSGNVRGLKLVVCSEGNSGFYEIGCMSTPMEAGFSVIGWNHPGFSGSTGSPLPSQEQSAIDAVMQYSLEVLGFRVEDVVLFAWSIGGYTASWASMVYPDVCAVVLDASFDHILPLAQSHMPQSWKSLINLMIPSHLNLNNAQLLCKYPGKLCLVRRTKDEIITTSESDLLGSNRGNYLLCQVLQHRYPELMKDEGEKVLQNWLSTDKNTQAAILNSYEETNENVSVSDDVTFPSDLGTSLSKESKERALINIARDYMVDFESTHCTHLPESLFRDLPIFRSLNS